MNIKTSEKGQALIMIAFAAIGLFAFSALAIDGSRAYSDKRHAQNAADTAVLAGALAYARDNDISTAAQAVATANGYDNGTSNDVTITIESTESGICPANVEGKDITVTIVSYMDTTFARVIGRSQITNAATATSRSCGHYTGALFDGNAIVSLAPSGLGFDAHGTPDWVITGGGIMSNSSSNPAADCGGSANVSAPGVTSVGTTGLTSTCYSGPTPTIGASQVNYSQFSGLFPRQPACNGTASLSGGQWQPQSGADGSKVSFSGDMDFAPGLYCVINNPGPFHGHISGSEVTFYITSSNFSMKFNGGGSGDDGDLTASAPTSGEYDGVLMYLAPQVSNGVLLNTQELDMRGNGGGDIVGTIIAPSADVTMFGNSGTGAFDSQVIAYQVDSGGEANITIAYDAGDNYVAAQPSTLSLLK
jgi:Flp pilus assembly protein TadG